MVYLDGHFAPKYRRFFSSTTYILSSQPDTLREAGSPTIHSPLAEVEHLKIVITGASGTVGRSLVRNFLSRGAQLLLVGRNPSALQGLFPQVECCGYDELAVRGRKYSGLLHLAVLNNDVLASKEDFLEANVRLTETVLLATTRAGIPRFVFASTVQALDGQNQSSYAVSKRLASEIVSATQTIETRNLYLSAVIGERLTGRLAILGKLPAAARKVLLSLYGALTPVVDIEIVANACWQALSLEDWPDQTIVTRDQSQNLAYAAVKRCIDLAAALVILIPFIWLLAAIWLLIRVQSPGPGIFAQQRVGQYGQVFTCYKFRTMAAGSPNVGTHEASTSLVTPLGRVLRRTKLDELPQAYNILLNQMSLVGPRPCLPNQDEVLAERNRLGVLLVKPGITGLAQIRKIDMSQPRSLAQLDAQYVSRRSLLLDVNILIQTVLGRGSGDAIHQAN